MSTTKLWGFTALLSALAVSLVATAQAQPAPASEIPTRKVLRVALHSDVPLDAATVRVAISRELAVRVEAASPGQSDEPTLDLRVSDRGRQLDATYRSGERVVERSVRLPDDRQAAIETMALLAGNLVRNEAAELLAELERERAAKSAVDDEHAAASDSAAPPQPPPSSSESQKQPKPKVLPAPPPEPKRDLSADQVPPDAPLPFNLSLFHPIALQPRSQDYTFHFELGLVYGRVGRIEGVAIDALVQRIDHGVRGAAFSGVWHHIDGTSRGLLVSGFGSSGTGDLVGAEFAGALSLRRGSVRGVQGSLVSVASGFEGAQLGLVSVNRGPMTGVQAGLVTVDLEPVTGVQAGLVGYARRVEGAQLGLVVVNQSVRGPQAGLVTVSQDVDGAELGLVNVGERVVGAQVGLVNIGGTVRGTQVGLVNVASHVEGEQVGLVSVGGTRLRLAVWDELSHDRDSATQLGLKFQGNVVYTQLGFGRQFVDGAEDGWVSSAALGVRVPFERFSVSGDVGAGNRYANDFTGDTPTDLRYRALLGWDAMPWLTIVAGGGLQHQVAQDQESPRAFALAGLELF